MRKILYLPTFLLFLGITLLSNTQLKAQCTLQVFANPVANASCPGSPDGEVTALGIFGTPPYTCVWTDNLAAVVQTDLGLLQGQASNFTSAKGGITYTATFTDATGTCSTFGQATTGEDFPSCVETTQMKATYCGTILNSMSAAIYADKVNGATAYKFRFTDGTTDHEYTRLTALVRPSELGLVNNETYNAFVSYRDGSGVWQPEGSVCSITTPPGPIAVLDPALCGTEVESLSSPMFCTDVSEATAYLFRFNLNGQDYTKIKYTNVVRANELGLPLGETFDAFVNWRNQAGVWQVEGAGCEITTAEKVITNFTANVVDICEGDAVTFTDISSGVPTSWLWDIDNDGNVDYTTQNATHTYNTAGTYSVRLTAANASGSQIEIKSGLIRVGQVAVDAGALTGPNVVCGGTTQTYSIPESVGATSYVWTIPTGATILAGGSSESITLKFGNTTGDVSVTPLSLCGNGAPTTMNVTVELCAPPTRMKASQCGTTVSAMNDVLYADRVNGATAYYFRFESISTGQSYNYVRHNNLVRPYELGLPWGETFMAYVSWRHISGAVQMEGDGCEISTPAPPLTELDGTDCGSTLDSDRDLIVANEVTGATAYEFIFTGAQVYSMQKLTRYIRPYELELPPNETFTITVNWRDHQLNWHTGTATCSITTAAAAFTLSDDDETELNTNSVNEVNGIEFIENVQLKTSFEVKAFPNPVQDQLRVNWNVDNAKVQLMSLTGSILFSKESNDSGIDIYMGDLSSGLYILTIESNGVLETKRIVKE